MYMYEVPGAVTALIEQQIAILEGLEAIKNPVDKGSPLLITQTKSLLEKLKNRVDELSKKLAEVDASFIQEKSPKKERKIEKVLPDDLLEKLGVSGVI